MASNLYLNRTEGLWARLRANCENTPERWAWFQNIPVMLRQLCEKWSLTLGEPYDGEEGSCAYVIRVRRHDGSQAVLKLSMPHMEGEHEIAALRFWAGDPTVYLLESDERLGAMLLEMCIPGDPLRTLPAQEQDQVIARLLKGLWRKQPANHRFRPLSALTDLWSTEVLAVQHLWPDPGLVRQGLSLLKELHKTSKRHVLLATDLHAGNVLRAERLPWLVIDPKPFVGDPAYDATQHLFNNRDRLFADPLGLIDRFSDMLEVDRDRVRLWFFARVTAESRDDWTDLTMFELARTIDP